MMMKHNTFKALFIALVALLWSGVAAADVPAAMTYTGQLSDDDGAASLSADMVFEIYDAPTGGDVVWGEDHDSVEVDEGFFSVELGESESLADSLDGSDQWLQVTIEGEALLPRTKVASVPYALIAGDAETVGGYTATELLSGGAAPVGDEVVFDADDSGLEASDVSSAIIELEARLKAAEASIADNEASLGTILADYVSNSDLSTNLSNFATGAVLTAVLSQYVTAKDLATTLSGYATTGVTNALELLTASMSVDGAGENVTFTGVNVHIENGLGATNGYPTDTVSVDPLDTDVNGLGNLIIGYDEVREVESEKSGSHNLVVGSENNYSSFGGIVVGYYNTTSGAYGSVSAGNRNIASGSYSSISGGQQNTASGAASAVSGGNYNEASVTVSSVSGGYLNEALGPYSSVSGGMQNKAEGTYSSASGGILNKAEGQYSSISGGRDNTAQGQHGSVSGGYQNEAIGSYSSVSGGYLNFASGEYGSVSGGTGRDAITVYGWGAGTSYLSDL